MPESEIQTDELISSLNGHDQILKMFDDYGSDLPAALVLTKQQLLAFDAIVKNDNAWNKLLEIASHGRIHDAWLAADWPSGFDELTICILLCKLVEWECGNCIIGKRQNNFSCAHDNSIFGYIGTLVERGNRDELLLHIEKVFNILNDSKGIIGWNIEKTELIRTDQK